MDYCQEHPEEISKIASVQKKVHERLTLLASSSAINMKEWCSNSNKLHEHT